MNIRGKLHEIFETKQVSENFKKRDFIVEYSDNPTYPQYIKFELHQNNTGILDEFKTGDEVEIVFDLRGKPWTNKEGVKTYFNSLVAWRIEIPGATAGKAQSSPQQGSEHGEGEDEDLPF